MCVKIFLSWFLNSTSSMNLKTVWPLLCILKQGWIEYGLVSYMFICCMFGMGFFLFSFFPVILILSSSVSTSEFYMFVLVPGKNLFASPNQGCDGGWYTDFPNKWSKYKKKRIDNYKIMADEKLKGLYLGLSIYIEIFFVI